MTTQVELIEHLKRGTRALKDSRVEDAFRAVDRVHFVPKELQDEAYEDYPLPIGGGQTVSQPTTVAFMLEKLEVRPGQKVLDVGSGSGWTTALLSHLVGETGKVIGLEIIPELVRFGQQNLVRCYSNIPQNIGITGVAVNGSMREGERLPNNLNISLLGVDTELLTLQLDAAGISVSTKSSCLKDARESYVVKALGGTLERSYGTLRFTLGRSTVEKDMRDTARILRELLAAKH